MFRVDLVELGAASEELETALQDAGFEVRIRTLDALPTTSADAVIVAGELDGAPEALRALRHSGRNPVVLMVGTPSSSRHRGGGAPGHGADAVWQRPVAADDLSSALQSLLASHDREGLGIDVRAATLELTNAIARNRIGLIPPRISTLAKTPITYVRSPAPEQLDPFEFRPRAALSDPLLDLLASIDRRIFPDQPPLDFAFWGGDESANELIPDELLEPDELGPELAPQSLVAFTLDTGSELELEPSPPADEPAADDPAPDASIVARDLASAPSTGVHDVGEHSPSLAAPRVRAPSDPPRRELENRSFNLLYAPEEPSCELEIELLDGTRRTLVVHHGWLYALDVDDIARQILDPSGRRLGQRSLDELIGAGAISEFEVDGARHAARKRELLRIAFEQRASVRTHRLDDEPNSTPVLDRPVRAALFEAARSLPVVTALELLSSLFEAPVSELELEVTTDLSRIARGAELSPELVRLIDRMDRRPLDALLDEVPSSRGLAGTLLALSLVGAIDFRVVPAEMPEPPRFAAERIEHAYELALSADYFTILGISDVVSSVALEDAYRERRAWLADPIPDAELESKRRIALESLDDAYRFLKRADLRQSYRDRLRFDERIEGNRLDAAPNRRDVGRDEPNRTSS